MKSATVIVKPRSIITQPLLLHRIVKNSAKETLLVSLAAACGVIAGITFRTLVSHLEEKMATASEWFHFGGALLSALSSGVPAFAIVGNKAGLAASAAAGATVAFAAANKTMFFLALLGGLWGAIAEIVQIQSELSSQSIVQLRPKVQKIQIRRALD